MPLGRNLVLTVVLIALSTGVACHRKRPNIPTKAQPPAIEQPTIPPVASQPSPTPPTVTPTESQPTPEPPAPAKTKSRRRHKPVPQPAPATTSKPPQPKPSESAPSEGNVQIQAEVSQGTATERRQQTESLLQAAEDNLKKINHSLTDGELSMQRQVRNFITQSRLAMQDGDLERAYNLATKAQLLSQELVK